MVNTGATSLLGAVFWVLAARLFPPGIVGSSSAVISLMLLAANVAELNLTSAVCRFLPTSPRPASVILRCYATAGALGCVAGLIALVLNPHLALLRDLRGV